MTSRKEIIPEFPSDISRDIFGAYISGFIDGEGCFSLCLKKDNRERSTIINPGATFKIEVRADDIGVLRLIQAFFQCGSVYVLNKGPRAGRNAGFRVYCLEHLANIIIPHFEKFPLFAKKKRDFEIWRQAVELMRRVTMRSRVRVLRGFGKRWTKEEESSFAVLKNRLHAVREFSICANELDAAVKTSVKDQQPALWY